MVYWYLKDVIPSFLVEHTKAEVLAVQLFGLKDFLLCHNLTTQISLQYVLKPKENRVWELSASTLKVGKHQSGFLWILTVVTDLDTIYIE